MYRISIVLIILLLIENGYAHSQDIEHDIQTTWYADVSTQNRLKVDSFTLYHEKDSLRRNKENIYEWRYLNKKNRFVLVVSNITNSGLSDPAVHVLEKWNVIRRGNDFFLRIKYVKRKIKYRLYFAYKDKQLDRLYIVRKR